jgi:hypothetical protein
MSRAIGWMMILGASLAVALPACGDEPVRRAAAEAEVEVDESWYYQPPAQSQPTTYRPNPKAIIHRKAIDRAAHRAARLETQYYTNVLRARPSVNPLPFQFNYVYGPPLVSNDWGNTQVSLIGDGNRATTPWSIGQTNERQSTYR